MKRLIQWINRSENEIGGMTGAACGEKSAERLVQRNGYRDRDWGEAEKKTIQ